MKLIAAMIAIALLGLAVALTLHGIMEVGFASARNKATVISSRLVPYRCVNFGTLVLRDHPA